VTASPKARSLWPREHGAYVQLAAPLATALVATTPTCAGAALALAACLAFLASEPLRIALGDRGTRQRERAGQRAWRRFAVLAAAALAAGAAGMLLAPAPARVLAGVVALPGALVLALSRRGAIHTATGECVAASALAGAAAPVAVANGMPPAGALVIWGAWSVGYATTVVAVHRVLAHHRRAGAHGAAGSALAVGAACVALVALGWRAPAAWFASPLVALAAAIVVHPPRATRLRAIGVGFLVSSIVAGAGAVIAVRIDGALW